MKFNKNNCISTPCSRVKPKIFKVLKTEFHFNHKLNFRSTLAVIFFNISNAQILLCSTLCGLVVLSQFEYSHYALNRNDNDATFYSSLYCIRAPYSQYTAFWHAWQCECSDVLKLGIVSTEECQLVHNDNVNGMVVFLQPLCLSVTITASLSRPYSHIPTLPNMFVAISVHQKPSGFFFFHFLHAVSFWIVVSEVCYLKRVTCLFVEPYLIIFDLWISSLSLWKCLPVWLPSWLWPLSTSWFCKPWTFFM